MTFRSLFRAFAALYSIVAFMDVRSAVSNPASMSMNRPKMDMSNGPAQFAPTRQAYTTNHAFLVKLDSLPAPIPFEKYFTLHFSVYPASGAAQPLSDAKLTLAAGMRHGLKNGFAHGMDSAPVVTADKGSFNVRGMFFHMMGPWVLKVDVQSGGKSGTAYFRLPCCGK